jgi:hypothetical protein
VGWSLAHIRVLLLFGGCAEQLSRREYVPFVAWALCWILVKFAIEANYMTVKYFEVLAVTCDVCVCLFGDILRLYHAATSASLEKKMSCEV